MNRDPLFSPDAWSSYERLDRLLVEARAKLQARIDRFREAQVRGSEHPASDELVRLGNQALTEAIHLYREALRLKNAS